MQPSSDRPTSPPDFDLQEFARESDSRVTAAVPVAHVSMPAPMQSPVDGLLEELLDPASEVRLTARAPIGEFLSLEAWAREHTGHPVVVPPPEVLVTLRLDHRGGFLLSLMDGMLDLETIVEVSAMARLEVLAIIHELHGAGVVEFR
jgi:hypothetical protein